MNHGTRTGYLEGCRCDPCKAASAEYMRDYRYRVRQGGNHYEYRPRSQPNSTIPTRPMHLLDALKPDWVAEAACRGATDLFFAERGDNVSIRKAKAICAGCPVTEECLRYAVDNNERFGIWGGLSPKERRYLRPGERRSVAECGTDAGYFRHRRALREEPCEDCRQAHAAAVAANDKKRRGAA